MLHWLLLWLLCGIVAAVIARFKQRSGCGYFLLGMIAGPLAFVVLAMPTYQVRLVTEEDVAARPPDDRRDPD